MNRLKELREEKGLKQDEVGRIIGVHNATISKYEVGTSSLTEDLIMKFCDLYGVTADYLLGRSSQRHASVSEMDAELLAAYHAAPIQIQNIVDTALEPYRSKKTQRA